MRRRELPVQDDWAMEVLAKLLKRLVSVAKGKPRSAVEGDEVGE